MLLALIGFSCQTKAGLLLEPYGSYFWGQVRSISLAQPNITIAYDIIGPVAGLRLGLIGKTGTYIAIDSSVVYAKERTADVDIANWTQVQSFLLLGMQEPKSGGRFYFGYGFDVRADETQTTNAVNTSYYGTAYKFGLGARLYRRVSISIEGTWYFMNRFERSTSADAISTLYSKYSYSAFAASLSFPLVL